MFAGDHGGELQGPDGGQKAVGPDQEGLPPIQLVELLIREIEQVGVEPLQLLHQLGLGDPEGVVVTEGGTPAHGHHLGLEAVGVDVLHVVAEHVAGLGGDQRLGLHHVPLRGVLPLDRLQLLGGAAD